VDALILGLEDASARRDGGDVDTHLQLLQFMLEPDDERLVRCQSLRELTWRRPGDPGLMAPRSASLEGQKDFERAQACQSGDARILEDYLARHPGAAYAHDEVFVPTCFALHSGDLDAIVAAAAEATRILGPTPRSVWALTEAVPVLTAPGQDVSALLSTAVSGPALVALGSALASTRPATGIGLLREATTSSADRTNAHVALATALVAQAASVAPDERTSYASDALAALDRVQGASANYDVWNYARVAALRELDPATAWDEIRDWTHVTRPLAAYLLGAAIAGAVGEDAAARDLRARAVNPALIESGTRFALTLGLARELAVVLPQAPADLVPLGSWQFYAAGGDIGAVPAAPLRGARPIPVEAMWRLAGEGHYEALRAAVLHRFAPAARIGALDGAPAVALEDLGVRGMPRVRALLENSRHPAYLRAAAIGIRRGEDLGVDLSELQSRAPGLAAGVTSR
jgi:hypothetical protein